MNELGRNQQGKEKEPILTKETFGVVCVLFSTLILVFLITGKAVFGELGTYINSFLYGVFGYFAFAVMIFGELIGIKLITDRKSPFSFKRRFFLTVAFVSLMSFLHLLSLRNAGDLTFGEYIKLSYQKGELGFASSTAGGYFGAMIAYAFTKLSIAGGCVVLGVVCAFSTYFFIATGKRNKPASNSRKVFSLKNLFTKQQKESNSDYEQLSINLSEQDKANETGIVENGSENIAVNGQAKVNSQRLFINDGGDFSFKSKREVKDKNSPQIIISSNQNSLNIGTFGKSFSDNHVEDLQQKIEYIKMPAKINLEGKPISNVNVSNSIYNRNTTPNIPMFEHDASNNDTTENRAKNFFDKYAEIEEQPQNQEFNQTKSISEFTSIDSEEKPTEIAEEVFNNDVNEVEEDLTLPLTNVPNMAEETVEEKPTEETDYGDIEDDLIIKDEPIVPSVPPVQTVPSYKKIVEQPKAEQDEKKEKVKKPVPINRDYHRPPLDLLVNYKMQVDEAEEDHAGKMEIIKETFEEFHINVSTEGYVQGPAVTRYEIKMPAGVSVKNMTKYDSDLRMKLASKNEVRIEAPIPGKNLVGIEVANKHPITVGLKEVLEGMAGQNIKQGSLVFALGKDIVGDVKYDNLAKGPHYLVAGATGSGKSVCLNVMIVSLIMRYSPEDLRLVLIDPKRVGFRAYEHLPHLLIDEIITEPQDAVAVLSWAYNEMERRYKMFEECPMVISDIDAYNKEVASDTVPKMPRIVVIVDELADLMETCKKDIESRIRMITQKARAAGIHLVLATQRPSVDVVTGTIKVNLPSRIALKVMNFNDSQTILSEAGAEKLLGNGDMLYKNSGMPECERYQGAWISDREINSIVSYIIEHNEAYFDDEVKEFIENETKPKQEEPTAYEPESDANDINPFFLKALWFAVNTGTISISLLQRRFQIGYPRAGGLFDKMVRLGFVSENEGSKARRVLLTKEEFRAKFGDMPDN